MRDAGQLEGSGRLRVGSLFSGVGGFDLGLERAGHSVKFACEFEPFRRRVLRHHFPGIPVFDDVRYIGTGVADRPEPKLFCRDDGDPASPPEIDLLCGGFPCQDLSVAGLRRGLAGNRSGLFFEFARCADEFVRPGGFILIENVPGLLSSNDGRDFAIVLATLAELGFYDLAYRVLDSRHFGVAQRRRRVFILGRRASGRVCAEVLLEQDGGHRHPPTSWEARARAARGAGRHAALHGGAGERVAATLTSSGNHASRPGRQQSDEYNLIAPDERSVHDRIADGDLTQSLTTRFGTTGVDLPDAEANWLVPDQRADDESVRLQPYTVRSANSNDVERHASETDTARALDTHGAFATNQGGTVVGGITRRYGKGTDSDATDALVVEAGDVREGAGSASRGGRRELEASGGEPDADGLRGRGGESLDAGGSASAGSGAPVDPDGVRAPARVPGRLDPRATGEVAQTLTVHNTAKGIGQAPDEKDYIVVPDGGVDHYAIRGREGGAQLEPTDLPNVRAHTGKEGGGHDHLLHDQRSEAFLPRHFTRGKDGAPDKIIPPLTKESDRGDGMAVVHTYTVSPGSTARGEYNELNARETDEAETLTAQSGRRTERGTLAQVPCIHPDAFGRDGVSRTPGADADGHVRKRDAGLGVIDDGTSYTLNTGAPPAVLAYDYPDGAFCPHDLQPDGSRFAAMGDAVTVNVAEWIGVRLRGYLERS